MILDLQSSFSEAAGQAVTANAASTNYIDLGPGSNRDIGTGFPLKIRSNVIVAMADTGSNSTCTVKLQMDDNSSFSSATNVADLYTFSAVSAAGTVKEAFVPAGAVTERYIRLYYEMANGDLSAGTFDSYVVLDSDRITHFADGITIS